MVNVMHGVDWTTHSCSCCGDGCGSDRAWDNEWSEHDRMTVTCMKTEVSCGEPDAEIGTPVMIALNNQGWKNRMIELR